MWGESLGGYRLVSTFLVGGHVLALSRPVSYRKQLALPFTPSPHFPPSPSHPPPLHSPSPSHPPPLHPLHARDSFKHLQFSICVSKKVKICESHVSICLLCAYTDVFLASNLDRLQHTEKINAFLANRSPLCPLQRGWTFLALFAVV